MGFTEDLDITNGYLCCMDPVVNLTVQILCHVGGEHVRKIMPCFRIQKGILSILEPGGKPIFHLQIFHAPQRLNKPASAEIQQNQASKNGWSPPDAILESVGLNDCGEGHQFVWSSSEWVSPLVFHIFL